MDGILCYSPRWDEACSDCKFAVPGGCKFSPEPHVRIISGVVVCEDYIKGPRLVEVRN